MTVQTLHRTRQRMKIISAGQSQRNVVACCFHKARS
jgi:ABC-type Mn2+/Zn2+ transport system ATPase subunit